MATTRSSARNSTTNNNNSTTTTSKPVYSRKQLSIAVTPRAKTDDLVNDFKKKELDMILEPLSGTSAKTRSISSKYYSNESKEFTMAMTGWKKYKYPSEMEMMKKIIIDDERDEDDYDTRRKRDMMLSSSNTSGMNNNEPSMRALFLANASKLNHKELFGSENSVCRKKCLRLGRSAIHAWGVFADEPLLPGDFVIEYKGEVIRPIVADSREKIYSALGFSDYMFRVDDDTIVDATMKGSIARFINHSCEPNCFTQIVEHDGKQKILIFAKVNISVGEELAYDYKFPPEENKIVCHCGSVKCRGYMN